MGFFSSSKPSSGKDLSFGRFLGPLHPDERTLEQDASVTTTRRRVFVDGAGKGTGKGAEVNMSAEDLSEKRDYIFYKTWLKAADGVAAARPGEGKDVCIVHGLYDAGGRWAPHIHKLLDSGFRVIAPDLPTHGRSSGLHCLIKDETALPLALDAVLRDVAQVDLAAGRPKRKAALVGHSLGGWTILAYGILSPFTPTPPSPETDPEIYAIYCIAPYLGGGKEAVPHPIVQAVGKGLNMLAPALPMIHLVTGLVSDHPDVDAEFQADPQTYSSKIRVGTGISLLRMADLINDPTQAGKIDPPVRVIHGRQDRVCDPQMSEAFVGRMKAGAHSDRWDADKKIDLWDNYEHVMHAYAWGGLGDKYEQKRDRVLQDMHDWLVKKANSTPSTSVAPAAADLAGAGAAATPVVPAPAPAVVVQSVA